MFSGNTILGDGAVIMIIDPNGIAQAIGTATAPVAESDGDAPRADADIDTVSLLVFRAGSAEPKAVPLSLVTRLEEIDCKRIEVSGGRHLVQYRGQPDAPGAPQRGVPDPPRGHAADPGVLGRRAFDGTRGRRDRRHRRRQARDRNRVGKSRLAADAP
jgi:hypothetical protein